MIREWTGKEFDPQREEAQLSALITSFLAAPPEDEKSYRNLLRQYPKGGGGFYAKADLIAGFRAYQNQYAWGVTEQQFLSALKMKPTRTQSGVAPITVLTKPFPCPGQCIFCPNDVRMPKSYLSEEPGALQAAHNRFDPYAQTWNRILSFYRMGHPIEKIEFIILGGTWSSYPRPYQVYFITRCFEAMNDFGATEHPTHYEVPAQNRPDFFDLALLETESPEPNSAINAYNRAVGEHLRYHHDGRLMAAHETADWERLDAAHRANESARCRVVGLVVETRPDHVDADEVLHLRRLGATKLQIGLQSMNDEILTANRRGHDVAANRRAVCLIRQAGFKIHAHWMANLFGATPESDVRDFAELYNDPSICPDELKLYPCSLIPKTELMSHFEAGRWQPYSREQLLELLCTLMPQAPVYTRLSRVIRDIPSIAIHAGNQETNFREVAERTMTARGLVVQDIRAREVRRGVVANTAIELRHFHYDTDVSAEIFISFETDDALLGFCRLSLPTAEPITDELSDTAMIREVHVYGQSLTLGANAGEHAQHRGLGTALVEEAVRLATDAGYAHLAVISAIGTRPYYRRLKFVDGDLYMHRTLSTDGRLTP